jgi:hypothetical protein
VSHWPFDYQFGFTKQALVGKIFRMLLCALMAINSLAVTSFLVMQDNITVRHSAKDQPDRRRFTRTSNDLIFLFATSLTPFPAYAPHDARRSAQRRINEGLPILGGMAITVSQS